MKVAFKNNKGEVKELEGQRALRLYRYLVKYYGKVEVGRFYEVEELTVLKVTEENLDAGPSTSKKLW